MSARSGIVKELANKMAADIDGTGVYVTNLYGNVGNQAKLFENIQDFPYVSITPGPETREYLPSRQTMAELTVYIRIYVKSEEETLEQLENIIADLENFIDTNQRISYNVNTIEGPTQGETIDGNVVSITTDEGLLAPFGAAELAVSIRYEKTRLM